MQDGNEYGSLIDVVPTNMNFRDELRRGMAEVEAIRKRPLMLYVANVLKTQKDVPVGILLGDDLPFSEMVSLVPPTDKSVDVMIVTPGGLAQQVAQFVSRLRPRFDHVAFLLPHVAMSAGTVWAMSGDEIWMDERASLGPTDPQVPGRDGRFLPAQALLALIAEIQRRGAEQIKKGGTPAWTDVVILRNMDPKEIGDAHTASQYSIQLVANYLENYKFRTWTTHLDGSAVTTEQRHDRAIWVANKLCDHREWKTHSHGISRSVAWTELKLKIEHPETVAGLNRAIRRLWTVLYYLFENTTIAKGFLSQQYALFRLQPEGGITK